MSKLMTIVILACLVSTNRSSGQVASENKDQTITELQAKVAALEARVAALEKQLVAKSGAQADGRAPDAQRQELIAKARARMRQDREKYTQQQIKEAEDLHQVANKNWRSPEAKTALEQLISKFPDLDRTGCAVLYLGQTTEGPDKEQLLKDAIEKHGDCFYGNGVQVGAYGRYLLGLYYKDKGEKDKAAALFDEIRKNYSTAIDHGGRSLVDQLPATPVSP